MKCLVACAGFAFALAPTAFAQSLRCPNADEAAPSKARKEFVVPFTASATALREGRLQDAISLADLAAPNAIDAFQLQAALSVRSAALTASHDDIQLVPTLEMRIQVGCFLRSGEADEVGSQLEAARTRSNSQSQR